MQFVFELLIKGVKAENQDKTTRMQSIMSCSFLNLDISISKGKLHNEIYDNRDVFSFPTGNFPF